MTPKSQITELYNLLHQYEFNKSMLDVDYAYFLNEMNKVAHRFNALKDQIQVLPVITVKVASKEATKEVIESVNVVTLAEEWDKNQN